MKRNIALLIEYDGSRYQGWQRLGSGQAVNTIQGRIEMVLTRLTGEPVQLIGSGRTDAGVHALGQVANFHTGSSLSCEEIQAGLHAYLPQDIGIRSVCEVPDRFHSRLNARCKTYQYHIGLSRYPHVFDRRYLWIPDGPLNLKSMQDIASLLVGTHDFKGFSSVKKTKKSTVRGLYSLDVDASDEKIILTFRGNGFLYNMVRILTGTIVNAGQGIYPLDQVQRVWDTGNREFAGITAPPQGLFLLSAEYENFHFSGKNS